MIPNEIWLGENIEPSKVWIGDILMCTKFKRVTEYQDEITAYGSVEIESDIYKKNAVLIEIVNNGFIDIDFFKNDDDNLKQFKRIYKCFTKYGWKNNGPIISDMPSGKNILFIDKNTLIPYYDECNKKEKTSVKKLKRER